MCTQHVIEQHVQQMIHPTKLHFSLKAVHLINPSSCRPGSIPSSTLASKSTSNLRPQDYSDDVVEILVSPDGDSLITMATNHGISVKQWSISVSIISPNCLLLIG